MKFQQKTCDICHCDWFITPQEVKLKADSTAGCLPGADGCSSLQQQLRLYFVARKLLKVSEREYLKISKGSSRTPGSAAKVAFSDMCARCELIVNEAIDLHKRMLELQQKIDQLGETLVEIKTVGDNAKRKLGVGYSDSEDENVGPVSGPSIGTPTVSMKNVARKSAKFKNVKKKKRTAELIGNNAVDGGEVNGEIKLEVNSDPEKDYDSHLDRMTDASKVSDETTLSSIGDESKKGAARQMLNLSLACIGKAPLREGRMSKKLSSPRKLRSSIMGKNRNTDNLQNSGQIKKELGGQKTNTDYDEAEIDYLIGRLQQDESSDVLENDMEIDNDAFDTEDKSVNEQDDSDLDYEPDEKKAQSEDNDDDSGSDPEYNPKANSSARRRIAVVYSSDEDENYDEQVEVANESGIIILEPVIYTTVNGDHLQPTASKRVYGHTVMEYQCPLCQKMLPSRQNLHLHTQKNHDFEIFYQCSQCPGLKFSRKAFIQHRNKIHGHPCYECGKSMDKRKHLLRHLETDHKMNLFYTCPLCKVVCKTRTQLSTHRLEEHNVNTKDQEKLPPRPPETRDEEEWVNTPCDICGKAFLSGKSLNQHIFKMHERIIPKDERCTARFKCFFCWQHYYFEQRRLIHIRLGHPDKGLTFPCDKCEDEQVTFASFTDLLSHLESIHTGTRVYECRLCGWPFLDEFKFQEHEENHKRKDPTKDQRDALKKSYSYSCYFCWDKFPDEKARQMHLETSSRHKVEFFCDVEECSHRFNNPFSSIHELDQHLSSAHADVGVIHRCSTCSWGLVNLEMMDIHNLNHHHSYGARYKCTICGNKSKSLARMKDHYNVHHGVKLALHQCKQCGMKFDRNAELLRHINRVHEDDSKIPCDQCGKLFKNEAHLKFHQTSVHESHTCTLCGQVFSTRSKWQRHRKLQHGIGTSVLCSICGKAIPNKSYLKAHMDSHKEKKYECHVCNVRMADLDKMREHIQRIHDSRRDEEAEFACHLCSAHFGRKDTLDDHIRVKHSQETYRVWECEQCGKRFKRSGYLEQHLKGNACTGTRETVLV